MIVRSIHEARAHQRLQGGASVEATSAFKEPLREQ